MMGLPNEIGHYLPVLALDCVQATFLVPIFVSHEIKTVAVTIFPLRRKPKLSARLIFTIIILLTIIYCIYLRGASCVLAAGAGNATFEFHIAADPCKNAAIIKLASETKKLEVWQDSVLAAKWVPVAKNADLLPDGNILITRPSKENGKEILVLITGDDITDSKVLELSISTGQYGERVVQVKVADSGDKPGLYRLTENNIGRYIIAVVDGQALNAVKIVSTLYEYAVIPGTVGEELASRISSDHRFVGKTVSHKSNRMRFTKIVIAAVIVVFSLFGLGVVKFLSRKKPCNIKMPRSRIVIVTAIGIILGACVFGVSRSWGSMQTPGRQSVLTRRIEIRLVDVFAGAVAGGILSYFLICLFSLRKSIDDTGKK